MSANLERELEEEEQRCEALIRMCEEDEKELRELDVLGDELEVRIKAVIQTQLNLEQACCASWIMDHNPSLPIMILQDPLSSFMIPMILTDVCLPGSSLSAEH